jgi:hypothetical protein
MTRRRPAHRLTSALIGAIVTAVGVLTIALLSGRELDTELISIIALASVGGWLLITAMLSGRRPRSGQWAAVPPASVYARDFSSTPPAAGTHDDGTHDAATAHSDEPPLTAAARKVASKAKRADVETPLPPGVTE